MRKVLVLLLLSSSSYAVDSALLTPTPEAVLRHKLERERWAEKFIKQRLTKPKHTALEVATRLSSLKNSSIVGVHELGSKNTNGWVLVVHSESKIQELPVEKTFAEFIKILNPYIALESLVLKEDAEFVEHLKSVLNVYCSDRSKVRCEKNACTISLKKETLRVTIQPNGEILVH